MGCKVEIADKIVAHKADYLLALKGNQPTLETDVEDYFRTAPAEQHGRIETRTYAASSEVDWIASERSYPGQPGFNTIKTIVKIHARVEYADRCSFDTHYYISSAPRDINASPRRLAAIGVSRACTGCSTSNSRTTSRATDWSVFQGARKEARAPACAGFDVTICYQASRQHSKLLCRGVQPKAGVVAPGQHRLLQ
jgi:hypothetical protein